VTGADPLFFLDYIGMSTLEPVTFGQIMEGLARGCAAAGCALIGGETAQLPGIYHGRDFDLVGCIVGVVERKKIIDGNSIRPGDVIIGLPSSGLHTNGYSLARDILFNRLNMRVEDTLQGTQLKLGAALLKVHTSYLKDIRKLRKNVKVKGMAHITGGGLIDNIPRILPAGTEAVIELGSWPVLPLFKFLAAEGKIDEREIYQVFNMGIGMVIIVSEKEAAKVLKIVKGYRIGMIDEGNRQVQLSNSKK
jgi:phosphoribosylformylglycinamidine cyclo-ligase